MWLRKYCFVFQFMYESERPNVHNQLLKQIQSGITLKRVQCNDRSKPQLDGKNLKDNLPKIFIIFVLLFVIIIIVKSCQSDYMFSLIEFLLHTCSHESSIYKIQVDILIVFGSISCSFWKFVKKTL